MTDFEVGKSPALDAHVFSHDCQTLRLDLAHVTSTQRMWIAHPTAASSIEERREDKSVAMTIGANEKHGASYRFQTNDALTAQIAQTGTAAIGPSISVETNFAVFAHAVRMDDIAIQRRELLNNVGGILDRFGRQYG